MTATISAEVSLPDSGDQNDVVERLRALAQEDRLSGRSAQLRKLADDLSNDAGLERWAEIDLYAAFLRTDTVEDRRRSRLRGGIGTVLDLLPAILIFLPIVVTWYGLYHATLAYRQSRGDPNLAGKSFLEQWQTGFDHRLSQSLYFDRIALWTLFGVGILVTVSLAQAVVRRRADRMDAFERTTLMRRLAAALTDADFQLSQYRVNDASRLALGSRELVEAADQVSKAGEVAKAIQREAHVGLREIRESLGRVRKLSDALLKSESSVRAAGQRVGDAVTGIGVRLEAVSAASDAVAAATSDLSRSVSADSANLRQSVQQAVTDSAAEMRTAVSQSQREAGARLSGAVDTSATNIREALDEWRKEGAIYSHRHETTADQLGLVVGTIEQLMDRMATSLDQLPSAVDRFESHSTQSAERLKRHMDRFVADLPAAESSADRITAQMAELQRSLDRLREQLGRLPAGRRRLWRWFGRGAT